MRFLTNEESSGWLLGRERTKPDLVPDGVCFRVSYPVQTSRLVFMAHWIAANLMFRRPVLLLITEWGIWPSS